MTIERRAGSSLDMLADNHCPSFLLQRANNTVLYRIARHVGEHGYKPEGMGEPKAATMGAPSSPEEYQPILLALYDHNWHERSALQSVGVRRSTGNDVSGPLFLPLFSFFFSIPFHFILRRNLFS